MTEFRKSLSEIARLCGMESIEAVEFDDDSNIVLSGTIKGQSGRIVRWPRGSVELETGPLPDNGKQVTIRDSDLIMTF
jgi:hypothetical protein